TCQPESVTLLGCDAAVGSVFHLLPGDCLRSNPPKLGGGGGTAFEPVFDWVEQEGPKDVSALIYFTDMYGSFPQQEPHYPVIWCKTTSQKAPWGEEIEVTLED